MISTGELRKGVAIELDGELWQILDYHHIKMGRGSAQVRITLRNIKRGQTVERSFQAGTKWPRASLEKRPVQFLYRDGDDFHFMDNDTYDQFILTAEQLGETAQYLKDGMTLDRTSYQGETIGVELPVTVDLKVVETEPGFAGDTQSGARKPAQTEIRPRRLGPDLRRAGRHDPDRHQDRGVSDEGLGPLMKDTDPPDWALPSWDAIPADPADRGDRLRPVGPGPGPGAGAAIAGAPGPSVRPAGRPGRSASGSSASATSPGRSAARSAPTRVWPTCGSRARSAGSPSRRLVTRTSRSRTSATSSSASGSAISGSARHSRRRPASGSSPTAGSTCSSRRARSSSTSNRSSRRVSAT